MCHYIPGQFRIGVVHEPAIAAAFRLLAAQGELLYGETERLRDPPTEWSRQFEALGLTNQFISIFTFVV